MQNTERGVIMKKSTLSDALRVNQKLLDLAEKASGDEKKDIENARKTFCDLIVHLSGGILQMGDAMDKQNDTIKQYQKALELAVYDKVLVPGCCNSCPFESNCDKENTTAIDCRAKFMDRWKTSAGIGVIDPARIR